MPGPINMQLTSEIITNYPILTRNMLKHSDLVTVPHGLLLPDVLSLLRQPNANGLPDFAWCPNPFQPLDPSKPLPRWLPFPTSLPRLALWYISVLLSAPHSNL